MSMRRAMTLLVVAALATVSLDTVAFAAWQADGSNANAAAKATTMPAGSTPNASVSGSSVTLTWTASSVAGTPVPGYVVKAYDATTNAPRTVGAACAGTITSTSCTESNVAAGSWRYTVTPVDANWSGTESAKSASVTVAPAAPGVVITFPSLSAYNVAGWNAGCSSSICGTASAGAGVKTVQVSVKQVSNNRYWNGTSFGTSSETFFTATGTTSWSLSFPASRFGEGSYTVHAVVTDNLNQTASDSQTFTSDNIAPSATVVAGTLRTGDDLTLTSVTESGSGIASVEYFSCVGASCSPSTSLGTVSPVTAPYALAVPLTTEGTYRVNATVTDNAGNQTTTPNQTLTIDNTSPTASGPTVVSSGPTNGKVDQGDQVQVTFSEAIDTSTLCSTWSGTGNQTLAGNGQVTVSINNNAGATGNDTLTVTTTGCTFHFGTVDLGSSGWVSTTRTFGGNGSSKSTIGYSSSTRTLTITLGAASGTVGTVSGSTTMTYTPDAAIADVAGNTIDTTPASRSSQHF